MRFLVVFRQKKNVDTFDRVLQGLLDDGHEVRLAIQDRVDSDRAAALYARFAGNGSERFELVACPEGRGDEWRAAAPLVRSARDWAQYFRPPSGHASKLRDRAARRFAKEVGAEGATGGDLALDGLKGARLLQALERIEALIPSDRLHEQFIQRHAPDAVLVSPGLHFGSAQADFIKSARALGIPAWMLMFSWDNLSTKGALHAAPDAMFVWNERQRREAVELHDYPVDRVVVAGAPRFDEFFTLGGVVARDAFLGALGLDPGAPTLLYVCSSRFIAERELPFVEQWLAALRASSSAALRACNVIVRPHPDITLVDGEEPAAVTWPAMPQATGWVQRPFADRRALVLRTTYGTPQAFYECLHHADAVVGLNTSAELEAGIAGRPVFTLLSHEEGADGQTNTLHFNYLLSEHGGFVTCAADMRAHVEQLAQALASPPDTAGIRSFIDGFLRPCGGPVSPLLARMLIERAASAAAKRPKRDAPGASAPSGAESTDHAAALPDDDVGVPEEARKKVLLGYPGSTARVLTTPETRRNRRKGVLALDEATVAWLDEHVHPGDTLYDIGAGVGPYSLAAALHRGALCVAFEPGFASFKRLCDNLLLNACYRSVIPLPIALGERTGLLEMEYPGEAGGYGASLRAREWRTRRDAIEAQYTQPVCAERLDDVVERHRLPKPQAIRISLRRGTVAALRGGSGLLRGSVRSVAVTIRTPEEADAVKGLLQPLGFTAAAASGDAAVRTLVLSRSANQEGPGRAVELLRRVAGRLRG